MGIEKVCFEVDNGAAWQAASHSEKVKLRYDHGIFIT